MLCVQERSSRQDHRANCTVSDPSHVLPVNRVMFGRDRGKAWEDFMLWRLIHRMGKKKTQQNEKTAQFEEHFSSETFAVGTLLYFYLSFCS